MDEAGMLRFIRVYKVRHKVGLARAQHHGTAVNIHAQSQRFPPERMSFSRLTKV